MDNDNATHSIRVILDSIRKHSGDVYGNRNADGQANIPFAAIDPARHGYAQPNDAVWPREQKPASEFAGF